KVANALGYSSNSVSDGVQRGMDNARAIAQKALADAQAAAGVAGRNVASEEAPGAASSAADQVKGAKADGKGPVSVTANPNGKRASGYPTAEQDLQARTLALNKSREEMLK